MGDYVERAGLKVGSVLAEFIEQEALPGTGIEAGTFWNGLSGLISTVGPRNRELLKIRDELQSKVDDWHGQYGPIWGREEAYQSFLKEIGYLVDEPADFSIDPGELDPEISTICGPQLVVPVSNARYALNAANARWGSLFDALYGTDAISRDGDLAPGKGYNAKRGDEVFRRAAEYLDMAFPLQSGSHSDVSAYQVQTDGNTGLSITLSNGATTALRDGDAFAGYGEEDGADAVVLRHHGLHMVLVIDPDSAIGKTHPAGLKDVLVEAAMTTIQDCEDSVAAVDAVEKTGVYRNWLGLMKGDLADTFEKGGRMMTRTLNADRTYTTPEGTPLVLKGRALQLVRNVGHLMTNPMVLDAEGNEAGEGIVDAAVTTLCALHDLKKPDAPRNSEAGRVYIVKPKMHGPAEVRFACDIFAAVEDMLGLDRNTIKIGIMDEERRTSSNLKAAIYEARERLFFINTGFLDRTGDEIHTSMRAGPVPRKAQIKSEKWLQSYEDRNVLIGLSCGLSGKAQIGKGMWAMPDEMAGMLKTKAAQPNQGANCAWVPSPTAATLHALHYHEVDVFAAQKRRHNEATPGLDALFSMPVQDMDVLDRDDIIEELENNAQGILGYVVRWVDQGVGCSKVPDIHDVGLMEDRATLRISSQHISNWLLHGVIAKSDVREVFERMAGVVDRQNESDPFYQPMVGNFETSVAFQAALELAMEGVSQPSGYTEPILHRRRLELKAG
ncbi:MAG: malate synthase G [Hyphomicrobiaceae bacterium]|nr:malate synthase G [Hyphomicrobiaceae bacterium]